jgi:cell division protein FtsB
MTQQPVDRTLMHRIGQLALALLNATLLLLVLLAICGIILINRVQSIAADTAEAAAAAYGPELRAMVTDDLAKMQTALTRLETIEFKVANLADMTDTAAAAELRALREEIGILNAQIADLTTDLDELRAAPSQGVRAALHQILSDLADRLSDPRIPPAPSATEG